MKKLLHERLREHDGVCTDFECSDRLLSLRRSAANALADEIERDYIPRQQLKDEVEVIRCHDCKYFNKEGECENDIWDVAYGEGYPYVAGEGAGNGFCAWAEKVD